MATKKPNILILWGDDIGIWNISHFSRGMMGYQTPNIDRIAKEGVTFTDYYSQQSCTAGRACFICGQNPIRTGLTKVGMHNAYFIYGAQFVVAKFVETFKAFPIIQKPNTFTVDDALRKMSEAMSESQAKAQGAHAAHGKSCG